jgi:hypothetical protein
MQVVGTSRDRQQQNDERQRQAVVDTRLDVEQTPKSRRHLLVSDEGRGEDWVGGSENSADQQRLRPVQPSDVVADDGGEPQRERHSPAQGSTGESPGRRQLLPPHPHAVGEQNSKEGELGEALHDRIAGSEGDDAEHAVAEHEAHGEEQDCRRQHGPMGQARHEHRDQQSDGERQEQSRQGPTFPVVRRDPNSSRIWSDGSSAMDI